MFCAISGVVPTVPVVATTTGLVYEKSTLLTALESSSGKCPVTSAPVDPASDLVEIKSTVVAQPRSVESTSIPDLLRATAREYDLLALENFKALRAVKTTTDELSKVLYKLDAATRVVARLEKERDEARKALTSFAPSAKSQDLDASSAKPSKKRTVAESERTDDGGAVLATTDDFRNEEVLSDLKKFAKASTKHRKKRKVLPAASSFTESSRTACPGTSSVASSSNQVLLGTASGVQRLENGVFEVVNEAENVALVASSSPTSRAFVCGASPKVATVCFGDAVESIAQTSPITGIAVHPLDDVFVASTASTVSLYKGSVLAATVRVPDANLVGPLAIHPDGGLCGVLDANNAVVVVDLTRVAIAAVIATTCSGRATSLAFAENGISLAIGFDSGSVQIVDLRNPKAGPAVTLTASPKTSRSKKLPKIESVAFDASATYLAVGNAFGQVDVFVVGGMKGGDEWKRAAERLQATKKPVVGAAFSGSRLFVASADEIASFE